MTMTTSSAVDLAAFVPHRYWECPNCSATHVTREPRPHTPFHPCRGMWGLTAPFVPAGTRAAVTPNRREDYLGSDVPHVDGDGRPVMSLTTTRDDGQDCALLAPTATAVLPRGEFTELRRRLITRGGPWTAPKRSAVSPTS